VISGGIIRSYEGRREKAMNMSKKMEVLQGPDESPSQFDE
jgi:hypothetical protein